MVALVLRLRLALLANAFRRSPWQVLGLVAAAVYGILVTVLAVGALAGLRDAEHAARGTEPVVQEVGLRQRDHSGDEEHGHETRREPGRLAGPARAEQHGGEDGADPGDEHAGDDRGTGGDHGDEGGERIAGPRDHGGQRHDHEHRTRDADDGGHAERQGESSGLDAVEREAARVHGVLGPQHERHDERPEDDERATGHDHVPRGGDVGVSPGPRSARPGPLPPRPSRATPALRRGCCWWPSPRRRCSRSPGSASCRGPSRLPTARAAAAPRPASAGSAASARRPRAPWPPGASPTGSATRATAPRSC